MQVEHREQAGEHEVWIAIDGCDPHDFIGFCVGVGPTKREAYRDAIKELCGVLTPLMAMAAEEERTSCPG